MMRNREYNRQGISTCTCCENDPVGNSRQYLKRDTEKEIEQAEYHDINSANVEKLIIKESKPKVRYMCKDCCGLELERSFKFCPYCGVELRWD